VVIGGIRARVQSFILNEKVLAVRFFFAAFGISVTMLFGRNPIATNELPVSE
jgi:hypothetical protein